MFEKGRDWGRASTDTCSYAFHIDTSQLPNQTTTSADDPKLTLPDNGHGLNGVKAEKSANGVDSSHDDPKEMSLLSRWARKTFTKKQLYRKVPILEWGPKYTLSHFISDAIAGTTVALTVIPQGIAYAIVAGLDPQVNKDTHQT